METGGLIVHRSRRQPQNCLWLTGGSQYHESTVSLFADLAGDLPHLTHTLFTNAQNHLGFPGTTYQVPIQAGMGTHGGLIDKYRDIFLAALLEGQFEEHDMVVTSSWALTSMIRPLVYERYKYRRRPVITVMASTPDVQQGAGVNVLDSGEEWFFWQSLGREDCYAFVLDNDHELELYLRRLGIHFPSGSSHTLKRMRMYQFKGANFESMDDRPPRVVWTGRWNRFKNTTSGLEICALLKSEMDLEYEMWVPSSAIAAKDGDPETLCRPVGARLVSGASQADFWRHAGSAAVVVVTSHIEAFGLAYVELAERGVIPVLPDRPWARTFLGPDWPLTAKDSAEAVEMVKEALQNQSKYRRMLMQRLSERYGEPRNVRELFDWSWSHYLSRSVEDDVIPESRQKLRKGGARDHKRNG